MATDGPDDRSVVDRVFALLGSTDDDPEAASEPSFEFEGDRRWDDTGADGEEEAPEDDRVGVLDVLVAAAESSEPTYEPVPEAERPETVEEIGGLTDRRAAALREGGYESVEALRAARADDLADVDGISRGLGQRIKREVGDRFAGADADPRPMLDAVDAEPVAVDARVADALDGPGGVETDADGRTVLTDAEGTRHVFDDEALVVDATDAWPDTGDVTLGRGIEQHPTDETAADGPTVVLPFGRLRRALDDEIEELIVSADWPHDGRVGIDGGAGIPEIREEPEGEFDPETPAVVSVKYADGLDVFQTGTDGWTVMSAAGAAVRDRTAATDDGPDRSDEAEDAAGRDSR